MVQVLQSQLKDAPLTTHNHLLAGALAGGVAATCTIPFDVGMLARSSRYHRRRCGRCRWLTLLDRGTSSENSPPDAGDSAQERAALYWGAASLPNHLQRGRYARTVECMHE